MMLNIPTATSWMKGGNATKRMMRVKARATTARAHGVRVIAAGPDTQRDAVPSWIRAPSLLWD